MWFVLYLSNIFIRSEQKKNLTKQSHTIFNCKGASAFFFLQQKLYMQKIVIIYFYMNSSSCSATVKKYYPLSYIHSKKKNPGGQVQNLVSPYIYVVFAFFEISSLFDGILLVVTVVPDAASLPGVPCRFTHQNEILYFFILLCTR